MHNCLTGKGMPALVCLFLRLAIPVRGCGKCRGGKICVRRLMSKGDLIA